MYAGNLPFPRIHDLHDTYEFDEHTDTIGEGMFATVYRGTHKSTHTDVAIKSIPKVKLNTEKLAADVAREVGILHSASHPNIVKLLDALQTHEFVYIIMELVDGGEIFSVLQECGQFTEAACADVIRQVLSALEYLHTDMNIVHRDVKPENVMLIADTLCVVLVDFGVARTFHEGGSPFACTPCGSLQYCAPEVVRGLVDDPLSPRLTTRHDVTKLDLYGVGVMTYIMLSGSFPFLCKTKEMLVSQMDRGVKFPSSKWSTQSVDARDFVARLMDPVASERPSASAALAHL